MTSRVQMCEVCQWTKTITANHMSIGSATKCPRGTNTILENWGVMVRRCMNSGCVMVRRLSTCSLGACKYARSVVIQDKLSSFINQITSGAFVHIFTPPHTCMHTHTHMCTPTHPCNTHARTLIHMLLHTYIQYMYTSLTKISSNSVPWSTLRKPWSQGSISSNFFSLNSSSSGGGGSPL